MLPIFWPYARLLPYAGRLRSLQDRLVCLAILGNGVCLGWLLLNGPPAPALLLQALLAVHAASALAFWTLRLWRAACASAAVAVGVALLTGLA